MKINIELIFICVRHCMRVWKKSDALALMKPMLNEDYYNNLIFYFEGLSWPGTDLRISRKWSHLIPPAPSRRQLL